MSRLLQRLARQALGGGGPRIRSAAAVHAQAPIAPPAHQPRPTVDVRPTLEARFQTTTPPAGAAPRDARVHESRAPADAILEARSTGDGVHQAADPPLVTRQLNPAEAVGEGMTRFDDQPFGSTREQRPPLVPPLIGETAASRPRSPFGPIRPARGVTKTAQDGEPTEVHVHIGRIEVTALPAPSAPKRRERAARQSPPLADYLAKRRPS